MSHWFYITPDEYELAAMIGISAIVLEVRIRSLGWSKERALTEPPQTKRALKGEWMKVAEQNGICYSTFRYRVNRLGWDMERAATQPLQDRKAQAKAAHEASRKYDPDLVAQASNNDVPYDTFRKRVTASKWSPEKAATTPVMTSSEIGLMTKDKRTLSFSRHSRAWNGSFVTR
ncbi:MULTISPECIES: hypothetical protein [unclassified Paenibacillus]|uniref:hypothetical protein n=1 Tax=unclassified Paenibacillus TaxID=185978 RepID=UPI002405CBE4|nr:MULTISPECIES: hypothetical protein [unclassified Paenibacillus]MDF9845125.1 hypothetical protein [Paenibacillus sp. PastF-2]MDF9851724.1 hypothetical protein [Paenibacillus sp. PastM-2]MDF9858323.1 hypothetical protein [Paenibacillus sp. PastF-1]MDH6483597.1 hypothetical protein [Paenibacillus sp. PastH-2]MDH6510998.1 hypothetical protein [Paenibacillus sp. PastM-3]